MFPDLNEDEMPSCGIEGVHPSILSIVAGFEISEAAKIVMGQEPALADSILHIDIGSHLAITTTRTFRAEECVACGSGRTDGVAVQDIILEELCGRGGGKRTFSITPTKPFEVDVERLAEAGRRHQMIVENQGEMGTSLRNDQLYVSVLQMGSAVVVGMRDEKDAVSLYKDLTGYAAA